MSIFQKIGQYFSRKESPVAGAVTRLAGVGQAAWTSENYENLAKEGFKKSVYVFRSIDMISKAGAGIPLLLYKTRGNRGAKAIARELKNLPRQSRHQEFKRLVKSGEIEEVTASPLLDLIGRPNPREGGTQLRENLIAYRLISGNNYMTRVGPKNGPPKELYALRPDRMQIVVGTAQNPIERFEYTAGGDVTRLAPEFVLHTKSFNPLDDWYGMGALVPASRSVDQNNEAKAHNVALIQNGGKPSGILTIAKNATEKVIKALLADIDTNWKGSSNAGKLFVFEDGMKWDQVGMSMLDMDWLEGQKLSAREISIAFGVPPQLNGDTEGSTYANYQEARKALYTETVLPMMDNFCDEWNRWLVPLFDPNQFLYYDEDAIEALQEDREKVYTRTQGAYTAGFITINEARQTVGYGEDPEYGHRYSWEIEVFKRYGSFSTPVATEKSRRKGWSIKASTVEQRDREYKRLEKQREPYYKAVEKLIIKRFEAESKAITAAIAGGKDFAKVLKSQESEWVKTLKAAYITVGEEFAKITLDDLSKTKARRKADNDPMDEAMDTIAKWASKQAPIVAKLITKTTGKRVQATIDDFEPEDIDGAAAGVTDLYATWTGEAIAEGVQSRSELISITENVTASGAGSEAGADASGLPLVKTWISTRDDNVRDSHQSADGQTVPMDEPFELEGGELMYPGDDSQGADSDELAGCRCFVQYELAGS